jgi:hypothetical protein
MNKIAIYVVVLGIAVGSISCKNETKNDAQLEKVIADYEIQANAEIENYERLFQSTIEIKYLSINSEKVTFSIKNNTSKPITKIFFNVSLFDAYNNPLYISDRYKDYGSHTNEDPFDIELEFEAINPENILKPFQKIEVTWNTKVIENRTDYDNYGNKMRDLEIYYDVLKITPFIRNFQILDNQNETKNYYHIIHLHQPYYLFINGNKILKVKDLNSLKQGIEESRLDLQQKIDRLKNILTKTAEKSNESSEVEDEGWHAPMRPQN